MHARAALKHARNRVLSALGLPHVARWVKRDALLVLTYHNIVPTRDDAVEGEASLHLDRATFAEQLDLLRETHDVVGLGELLNGCRWPCDRPRALITFDDAYRGALTIGAEELAKRHMVATVFVAPGFVGGRTFWWDAIAAAHAGELPDSLREIALREHHGRDDLVRSWAAGKGVPSREPGPVQRAASVEELRAAARLPGITFAAHSWSHAVLPDLRAPELREELERPLQWLRAAFDNVLPALAVPYGLSSRWVEIEARRLGYAVVFPGMRGWVPARASLPFTLPRENVPSSLPSDAFKLRTAGLRA